MSLPWWARLVVLIAGIKAALGLVVYLSGYGDPSAMPTVPVWVYAALSAAFAGVGGLLVAGNRHDPHAGHHRRRGKPARLGHRAAFGATSPCFLISASRSA